VVVAAAAAAAVVVVVVVVVVVGWGCRETENHDAHREALRRVGWRTRLCCMGWIGAVQIGLRALSA
jgi:hypothetical protein